MKRIGLVILFCLISSLACFADELDQVIKQNELALKQNPEEDEQVEILYQLSNLYYEKTFHSRYSRKNDLLGTAIRYGKECLALNPDHWQVMITLARAYMLLNDLEKSDFYFTEAEKINPKLKTFSQSGFISEHGAVLAALNIRKELEEEKAASENQK